jgi:hypothetical protein
MEERIINSVNSNGLAWKSSQVGRVVEVRLQHNNDLIVKLIPPLAWGDRWLWFPTTSAVVFVKKSKQSVYEELGVASGIGPETMRRETLIEKAYADYKAIDAEIDDLKIQRREIQKEYDKLLDRIETLTRKGLAIRGSIPDRLWKTARIDDIDDARHQTEIE